MLQQTHMTVALFSHHFEVSALSHRGRFVCSEFGKRFYSWEFKQVQGQNLRHVARVYAASNVHRTYYRFHISTLEDFKKYVADSHIQDEMVAWIAPPEYTPAPLVATLKEGWVARADQQPYVDYLTNETPKCKLVPIQTGKGKTAIALISIAKLAVRAGIFIKPMYIEKWVSDVMKMYNIDKNRILVIQGSKSLLKLFSMAKEGTLDVDFIIFSLTTVQQWIDRYEEHGDNTLEEGYDLTPDNWMNKLGIGVKLVDEVHQFFHAMFKLDLYTHVKYSIALSATLVHQNPFLMRMYDVMFPGKDRPSNMALHRYARAIAVHYNFVKPEKIRTTEYGSNNYSHGAVENSIMRHVPTLQHYLRMIEVIVEKSFLSRTRPKKRLLIFAYRIEMCTLIQEHLKKKFPNVDTRRYVDDDPYENIMEAEICVSTIGSAGTAIDIADLVTVIMTTAISSVQANIQALGRLREIPGEQVEFYFLTADNLPKHVEYCTAKKELFKDRVVGTTDIFNGFPI